MSYEISPIVILSFVIYVEELWYIFKEKGTNYSGLQRGVSQLRIQEDLDQALQYSEAWLLDSRSQHLSASRISCGFRQRGLSLWSVDSRFVS